MSVWKININKSGSSVTFEPLNAVVGDQIFWVNNDGQKHWPAPIGKDGNPVEKGFLNFPVLPHASSQESFSPNTAATYNYCCAIHPQEKGQIVVTATPPAPTSTRNA